MPNSWQALSFILILLSSVLLMPMTFAQNSTLALSPLEQVKTGISTYSVICKQGLVLVIKTSDSSPACVKPDTAQKLVERGWGTNTIQTSWLKIEGGESSDNCKHIPWTKELVKSNDTSTLIQSTTNATLIKKYFYNHGITLLQVKANISSLANPFSTCGLESFYILVLQNDTSKMIELGFKSTDEKEVQDSGAFVIKLANAEQKIWFSYFLDECQQTPWARWSELSSIQWTEAQWMKQYFKEQGITILDARELIYVIETHARNCAGSLNKEPSNNESTNGVFYYFLVSTSDTDKMTSLGYKKVDTVPDYAHSVK
jgi:hypothetical protein